MNSPIRCSAPPRSSDLEFIQRHRSVWAARPELRAVYHEFFAELLRMVQGRAPIVELGAGPGFFKEYYPGLISTDVIPTRWVDVVCDAGALPFPSESVGAMVMLDVLHHLPRPLDFMAEASRVLKPGGHVAFEVGEVHGGKTKLEEAVLPCGVAAGLEPELVLINDQQFTKTANCWGVDNMAKGTNTNRIVLFRREP